MDIQWSAKRTRSRGGSRRTVQEQEKELANLEKKEQEAVEAI
jgi:hypothetical protein